MISAGVPDPLEWRGTTQTVRLFPIESRSKRFEENHTALILHSLNGHTAKETKPPASPECVMAV